MIFTGWWFAEMREGKNTWRKFANDLFCTCFLKREQCLKLFDNSQFFYLKKIFFLLRFQSEIWILIGKYSKDKVFMKEHDCNGQQVNGLGCISLQLITFMVCLQRGKSKDGLTIVNKKMDIIQFIYCKSARRRSVLWCVYLSFHFRL